MEFQRAYYAGVSFMDAQVGRPLDTLDRLKLWVRTVVISAGDRAQAFDEVIEDARVHASSDAGARPKSTVTIV